MARLSKRGRLHVLLMMIVGLLLGIHNIIQSRKVPKYYAPNYTPRDFSRYRMFGTSGAQDIINAHQHPSDCSKVRFLRVNPPASGFGSTVHKIGAYLAHAMNTNRVLILKDDSLHWWGAGNCRHLNGHECFFRPLTYCRPEDESKIDDYVEGTVDLANEMPAMLNIDKAPTGLPDTPDRQIKYWWRAQASAYILRLNLKTSLALKNRRVIQCPITVHIRRGEKGREMILPDLGKYVSHIERIPSRGCIFLITEDQEVVEQIVETYGKRVKYYNRHRTNADFSTSLEENFLDISNLFASLESTHFVGTLGSNWDRLTDELRRVLVGPAKGCCTEFIEVGCPEDTCAVDTRNW